MCNTFIGRKQELKALQDKFDKRGFQMAVVYGRRRIGKTTLLNKFMADNNCVSISFVAVEQKEAELLSMMSAVVLESIAPELAGSISFDSFDKLFSYIATVAKDKRIIFVIDEYPYLAKECTYMNSLLQKFVDHDWKHTNLFLILCGSLVSFMSDEVLGKDAPLHGRSNIELKLRPFDYYEAAQFVPDYSNEDKAVVYGLTNGVAKYLEQFDPALDLNTNIINQFFTGTGYFTTEQIKTIITGDKLNPVAYNTILAALASGYTKYSELSQVTGIDNLKYYLDILIESELVEKRNSKKPYYIISDNMLNFWFRFVNRAASLINADRGKLYYMNSVQNKLHEYMGKVFEEMAKQYIYKNTGSDKIPVMVTDIVEYQNSIKTAGEIKNIEIDLLGRNGKDNVLIGECKFKEQNFAKKDLDNFLSKISYIPAMNPAIILFSLSGFSETIINNSDKYILVDINDMYR